MRRRPKIREVDVEVVSASDLVDAGDRARPERPPEPADDSVRAEPREPPQTRDDAGGSAEGRRSQERPAWPAPVPVRDTNVVTQTFIEQVCEIALWRGYLKAAFYARLVGAEDPLAAVAQSPYFRRRGAALPECAGEALSAYEALRRKLEDAGWERVRSGTIWFADVFCRRA